MSRNGVGIPRPAPAHAEVPGVRLVDFDPVGIHAVECPLGVILAHVAAHLIAGTAVAAHHSESACEDEGPEGRAQPQHVLGTAAPEGPAVVDLGRVQEAVGVGGEVPAVVEVGGREAVDVVGHPHGIGPVPAKGSKPWRRSLLISISTCMAPMERQLVLRHVALV